MWMRRYSFIRRRYFCVAAAATALLAIGAGAEWAVKHSFNDSLGFAAAQGWTVTAAGPLTLTFDLGPTQLGMGPLRWGVARARYRPGWNGGRLVLDGPHTLRWADSAPVTVYGTAQLALSNPVSVDTEALRLVPDGVPAGLRWSPAVLPGTLTLTGAGPALAELYRRTGLAPVQAAAAVIMLLEGAGGHEASIPLTHGRGWLEAASFPLVRWPD